MFTTHIVGERTGGRLLALVGVLALALALLAAVPATAQEDDEVTPARVAGPSRFHTAASLATLTFEQADVAHLAFADKFPDALAASYAAGVVDGPILLSPRDGVGAGSPTMHALEQLGVQEVRLVGGPGVLSPAVAQELRAHGYEVRRIFGDDRYATAAQVAMFYGLAPGQTVGTVQGQRTAVMATGANFPDALAVGPIAAAADLPLVLTPLHHSHPATEHALARLGIERIHLIGGPGAVSEAVAQHYRNLGYTVERQAGPNRMATAALLADIAKHDFGFTHDLILLARGDDFPDALAASVHGAATGSPILLTHTPHHLSRTTAQWLARTCPDIDAIRALGGPRAVSPGALDAATDVAAHCLDSSDPEHLVAEPSFEERQSEDFGESTEVVDVRTAAHDGFDRLVLEFAGPERPGWAVDWADEPRYAPSDQPAQVEGEAFLRLTVRASDDWGGQDTYPGPDRIRVDGNVVTEVLKTSDFEGYTEWTVGLQHEAPFAVALHDDPVRFVLDVVDQ